eukprot:GHUV01037691.1.p1 GENE.GHUV01037691.1~~GHUV01037691.1.p1  ORF type:complete len:117 (+),score=14.80 GHUV01037691.1:210-560(+)
MGSSTEQQSSAMYGMLLRGGPAEMPYATALYVAGGTALHCNNRGTYLTNGTFSPSSLIMALTSRSAPNCRPLIPSNILRRYGCTLLGSLVSLRISSNCSHSIVGMRRSTASSCCVE